jgi:hypothetical protein
MPLSYKGIRVGIQGIIVVNDLEELQYSNIGGEERYSLLGGSFGSNNSIEVPLECTIVLQRGSAY